MDSLQKRIAAYADASANLLAQLNELNELRERVKKALPFAHLRPESHPPAGRTPAKGES